MMIKWIACLKHWGFGVYDYKYPPVSKMGCHLLNLNLFKNNIAHRKIFFCIPFKNLISVSVGVDELRRVLGSVDCNGQGDSIQVVNWLILQIS